MIGRLAIVADPFPPLPGRVCGVEDPFDQATWQVEGAPARPPPPALQCTTLHNVRDDVGCPRSWTGRG